MLGFLDLSVIHEESVVTSHIDDVCMVVHLTNHTSDVVYDNKYSYTCILWVGS